MISAAYQYYMTTYAQRESSRFDTHKKSELRNVYNKIVRLNKKSPLYKVNLTNSVQNFAIDLKESSRAFRNVILETSGDDETAFEEKNAFSSNEEALEAAYIGSNASSEEEKTAYRIDILELARPQVNTGDFVPSNRLSLSPDQYSFDLTVGSVAYEFQFKVSSHHTNLQIQEKLAGLINRSNVGITAAVIKDGNGSSALEMTASQTGYSDLRGFAFRISDSNTSKESGSVELFGLDQISQQPKNAHVIINGSETSSPSNTFSIGNSYLITLKDTTELGSPVEVGMKRSVATVFKNMSNLAGSFNSLHKLAEKHAEDTIVNDKLSKTLNYITKRFKNVLDTCGLMVQEDGTLSPDEALITQAAQDGSLDANKEDLFAFRRTLLREMEHVSLDPMNYVNRKMIAYPNPVKTYTNPYHTSLYSGMIFNGYI